MLQSEILIVELRPINTDAPSAITFHEVTTLAHEARDDAMKG